LVVELRSLRRVEGGLIYPNRPYTDDSYRAVCTSMTCVHSLRYSGRQSNCIWVTASGSRGSIGPPRS
jgi:hypothetical protein